MNLRIFTLALLFISGFSHANPLTINSKKQYGIPIELAISASISLLQDYGYTIESGSYKSGILKANKTISHRYGMLPSANALNTSNHIISISMNFTETKNKTTLVQLGIGYESWGFGFSGHWEKSKGGTIESQAIVSKFFNDLESAITFENIEV